MTREEIEARIAKLKEEDFIIGVSSDFLSSSDMNRIGEIAKEIRELQKALEVL